MYFGKYDCNAPLQDVMLKDKVHDTHTAYIAHIYTGNPLIADSFYFCFVLKYIQNCIKGKYLFSFHNKNARDSSLHYITFLFYFRAFPGIP